MDDTVSAQPRSPWILWPFLRASKKKLWILPCEIASTCSSHQRMWVRYPHGQRVGLPQSSLPPPHQGALSQGLESAAEWKPSSPLQVRTNSEAYSRSRVPLWNQAGTSLEITPLCSSSSSLLWFPRFLTDFPRSTSPVNHVHMIPWLGAPLGTLELRNLLRN